jgi:hypothetical protein
MTIAQMIGKANQNMEASQKVRDFHALARIVMLSKGHYGAPQQILERLTERDPRSRILMGGQLKTIFEAGHKVWTFGDDVVARQKAAVAAGTTLDSGWALPLADYQVLASAFLESLRNFGCFDRLLPSMRKVPFRTRIGASTVGVTGATVPQASVKPISRLTLSSTQIDEIKVAAILIVTDELARFGDAAAGNLFATELSNAIAVATDTEFVAQLTSGATSFTSNGVTAEHTRVDLRGLLANITTGARSQLFLLTTSSIARSLSVLHTNAGEAAFEDATYNGGSISGIPIVVSDGVPSGTMLLVDATQLAAASDSITLDSSREALLQLDTAPDSPVVASTPQISLFQMDMVGLRAERTIGIEKLTTTGVSVVTGVAYSGDSPGP